MKTTARIAKNGPRIKDHSACAYKLLAINDALDVLRGKWKIQIINTLTFGKRRFKELQREVNGITAKMLSKELRELEMNELVLRTVRDTIPVTVEYELTDYGTTLDKVIDELSDWGMKHRKRIIKKR
ncbi:MAG: helix-turn-helix domain-containing protein [Bacteroidota bacterium]|nr:helix-turn-helix domain-containing protein [Bacteroidota bacterium]